MIEYIEMLIDFKRRRKSIKGRARRRDQTFSLSTHELRTLFLSRTTCPICSCTLTHIPNHANMASVDRINPQEGYHYENCAIICRQCNTIKSVYDQLGFAEPCTNDHNEKVRNWILAHLRSN